MARDDPQVNVRFPQEIKEALSQSAKANNRSMNAEIVARLSDETSQDFAMRKIEKYRKFSRKLQNENVALQAKANQVDAIRKEAEDYRAIVDRLQSDNMRKTTLIYNILEDIAIALSNPERTVEDERDLLAAIIKVMSSFKN